MRANYSQGARRQAQNHDRKRGASRHAAKGTAMAARKGRRSCGLPRKFGPHEQLLSHLPTYRSSHPSHLLTSLLPDVSPYLLILLLPLVLSPQQNVDAKARRSLNKTFLYKDERRSLNKTRRRRLGLPSATHRLRKGPPDEAKSPQSRQMMPRRVDLSHVNLGTRS